MTTFKLTKDELARRETILQRLQWQEDVLTDALTDFNDELGMLRDKLQEKVEAYNAVLADAKEFANEIGTRIDEDVTDMSEKWQEGEKAQAVEEMKQDWEGLDLDEIEVDFPADVDISASHAEDFENAPLEPDA